MNNEEREAIFRFNGAVLGYPQCCIDEFCKCLEHHPMLARQFRTEAQNELTKKHWGFIPCAAHAEQIITGAVKVEDILINRDPDIPAFPDA